VTPFRLEKNVVECPGCSRDRLPRVLDPVGHPFCLLHGRSRESDPLARLSPQRVASDSACRIASAVAWRPLSGGGGKAPEVSLL
jgi:hypothetical protein